MAEVRAAITVKDDFFRYLWVKRVTGFDPSHHCAKCLIGPYVVLPWQKRTGVTYAEDVNLRDGFLYVCGVSPHWETNLHILCRPGKDRVEYDGRGVHVVLEGVEQIEIKPLPASRAQLAQLGLRAGKSFTTCRNYQAGAMLYPVKPGEGPSGQRLLPF